MDAPHKNRPEAEDVDATLAANFNARLNGRSIQALRQQMAERGVPIGSAAIQAVKMGSRGVRLETLQKFADFFGCKVVDLLIPEDQTTVAWPFQRLTPAAYAAISGDVKEAAEDMLISSSKRAGGEGQK